MTFFESIVPDGDFFLTQWFDGIFALLKVYLQLFSQMMHTLTDLQLLLDIRGIDIRGFEYSRLIPYLLLVPNLL